MRESDRIPKCPNRITEPDYPLDHRRQAVYSQRIRLSISGEVSRKLHGLGADSAARPRKPAGMGNDFDAARVALRLNELRLPALKRVWRERPPGR